MIRLDELREDDFIVKPRWPCKQVFIADNAYQSLQQVQRSLTPHNVRLILTRGYESEGWLLRQLHKIARCLGAALFCLAYPWRAKECREIFSANGHNLSGNCIDLAILYEGKRFDLLPYGVFTPKHIIESLRIQHRYVIDLVWRTLELADFRIHPNATEAMQIHCEFYRLGRDPAFAGSSLLANGGAC